MAWVGRENNNLNMEKQEIDYLKLLGFESEFPDEPDYSDLSFRLDIEEHTLLTGLYVVVSSKVIEVWCLDCVSTKYSSDVCVATREYTRKNLEALLQYLS